MPSAFVPVYTPDRAQKQLQDRLQRATTQPAQSSALRTSSFDAAAGGVYRVRAATSTTIDVRLPPATPANYGKEHMILIMFDQPVGSVRVSCPTGTINAAVSTTYAGGVSQAKWYASNGAGGWLEVD